MIRDPYGDEWDIEVGEDPRPNKQTHDLGGLRILLPTVIGLVGWLLIFAAIFVALF